MVFKGMIGAETWKVGGMLIGCYTGGTPNFGAIGTALRIDKRVLASAQISDVAVGALYLLLMVTVAQKILLRFLPAYKTFGPGGEACDLGDYDSYEGIFRRDKAVPLLGVSFLIVCAGVALTFVVPKDYELVAAVLAVCTLAIACSFIPAVRWIHRTFQLGQYLILVFCVVVSSMSDLRKLFTTTPAMIGFVAWAVFFGLALHAFFGWLFKIDTDTLIITSVAGAMSPPFVPMITSALKNREVVVSGVVTGVIGWVIGTYLGIGFAYLIRLI